MLHAQYINLCLTKAPIRTTMIPAWERSEGPTASSGPTVTAHFIVTNSLCGVSECDRIVSVSHPMRPVPCPAAQEQRVSASPPGRIHNYGILHTWLTVFDRPDSSRDCSDTKGNLPKGIQGHRVAGLLPRFIRRFEPVSDGVFSLFQRIQSCLNPGFTERLRSRGRLRVCALAAKAAHCLGYSVFCFSRGGKKRFIRHALSRPRRQRQRRFRLKDAFCPPYSLISRGITRDVAVPGIWNNQPFIQSGGLK